MKPHGHHGRTPTGTNHDKINKRDHRAHFTMSILAPTTLRKPAVHALLSIDNPDNRSSEKCLDAAIEHPAILKYIDDMVPQKHVTQNFLQELLQHRPDALKHLHEYISENHGVHICPFPPAHHHHSSTDHFTN